MHCRGTIWHVPPPTVQTNAERFHHPASFPPALAELAIKLSGASGDDLVLDPYAGIGSTLVAAQRLGLNAIGIEIDPAYCAAARQRLGQYLARDDLFAGSAMPNSTAMGPAAAHRVDYPGGIIPKGESVR